MKNPRFSLLGTGARLLLVALLSSSLFGCVKYYYPNGGGQDADLYFSGNLEDPNADSNGLAIGDPNNPLMTVKGWTPAPWLPSYLAWAVMAADWLSPGNNTGNGNYWHAVARNGTSGYTPWYGWGYPYGTTSGWTSQPCGAHWTPWAGSNYNCPVYPYFTGWSSWDPFEDFPDHDSDVVLADAGTSPETPIIPPEEGVLPSQRLDEEDSGRGDGPPSDYEDSENAVSAVFVPLDFTGLRVGNAGDAAAGEVRYGGGGGGRKPGLMRPHNLQPGTPVMAQPSERLDVSPLARSTIRPVDFSRMFPRYAQAQRLGQMPAAGEVRSSGYNVKSPVSRTHISTYAPRTMSSMTTYPSVSAPSSRSNAPMRPSSSRGATRGSSRSSARPVRSSPSVSSSSSSLKAER